MFTETANREGIKAKSWLSASGEEAGLILQYQGRQENAPAGTPCSRPDAAATLRAALQARMKAVLKPKAAK